MTDVTEPPLTVGAPVLEQEGVEHWLLANDVIHSKTIKDKNGLILVFNTGAPGFHS